MLENIAASKDKLLGGRVQIEQPETGYRAAIDPVLLAAAVPARPGERVLELGLGAGAASFCLLAREPEIHVTGLEKEAGLAALAHHNAALNGVEKKLEIICGAVGMKLDRLPFDHVFANPPYHDTAQHGDGDAPSHMPLEDIADWVRYGFRNLRDKGRFTLIHRADALSVILAALSAERAGAIKILPIAPREDEPASRVIVSAIKGRKTPLELLPPFIVHEQDGGYTPACEAILRNAAPLPL